MFFPEDLLLTSARLVLRSLRATDAQALFAIQSDPVVMRYWNHAPWTALEQATDSIAQDLEARRAGSFFRLGLFEREGGALVGTCMAFAHEPASARIEIGYNLAQSAQGRGYMDEALRRFVDYLIDDLRLRRLEAETDPRNAASGKVLARLGFRQEGLLRERWVVEGEVSDSALFGLLADDYRRLRQQKQAADRELAAR